VLWSNPGNSSGVGLIVPAVPSPTGVADVFAFQNDGTVQAITSDGTTAWTADVSTLNSPVPDFQGGLVGLLPASDGQSLNSLVKLDGMTGQRGPAYTVTPFSSAGAGYPTGSNIEQLVPNPDGTVFAVQLDYSGTSSIPALSIAGVDPVAGSAKFQAQLSTTSSLVLHDKLIVAGDGKAYLSYETYDGATHLMVAQVDTSGTLSTFEIKEWNTDLLGVLTATNIITNADRGVLLTWKVPAGFLQAAEEDGMATVGSAGVSVMGGPAISGQDYWAIQPMLQAQDGSFIGAVTVGPFVDPGVPVPYSMVAFDASGNVRWSVPDYIPVMATDDGGVIAIAIPNLTALPSTPYQWANLMASASAVTFDSNLGSSSSYGRTTAPTTPLCRVVSLYIRRTRKTISTSTSTDRRRRRQ
jgi:hypothetical protein